MSSFSTHPRRSPSVFSSQAPTWRGPQGKTTGWAWLHGPGCCTALAQQLDPRASFVGMPISTLVHADTEGLGPSPTRAQEPFSSEGEDPKKVGMEVKSGFYSGARGGRVGEAEGYHPAKAGGPRGSREGLPVALEKASSVHLLHGENPVLPYCVLPSCGFPVPLTQNVSPDTSGHQMCQGSPPPPHATVCRTPVRYLTI